MNEPFDVIVVGAGSSGAVVAARAAEDPRRSVLLVEAGPDYPDLSRLPFDLVNSHNNSYTAHDWGLAYQPTAAGRSQPFPRGRVTGGSSAVNTTIALRGVPEDYDGWAAAGNPEWALGKGTSRVLPPRARPRFRRPPLPRRCRSHHHPPLPLGRTHEGPSGVARDSGRARLPPLRRRQRARFLGRRPPPDE